MKPKKPLDPEYDPSYDPEDEEYILRPDEAYSDPDIDEMVESNLRKDIDPDYQEPDFDEDEGPSMP